jgi:CRP-like cAMP-binding protein
LGATVAQTVVQSAMVAATVAKIGQTPARPSRRRRNRGATERDARTVVVPLRSIDNQQDLADRLGVHKATVSRWMQKWEAEGIITRDSESLRKVAPIRPPVPPAGCGI